MPSRSHRSTWALRSRASPAIASNQACAGAKSPLRSATRSMRLRASGMPGHSRKQRSSASFTLSVAAGSYQACSLATRRDSRAALLRSRSSRDMPRSMRARSRHVCSKRCSVCVAFSARAFCGSSSRTTASACWASRCSVGSSTSRSAKAAYSSAMPSPPSALRSRSSDSKTGWKRSSDRRSWRARLKVARSGFARAARCRHSTARSLRNSFCSWRFAAFMKKDAASSPWLRAPSRSSTSTSAAMSWRAS